MGEREEIGRPPKLPAGLTIRVMDSGDLPAVAWLLQENPDLLRDDYMVSLVAYFGEQLVAVLRGWLGHPHGHIEVFDIEAQAAPRVRYIAGVWLLRAFEGLLESVGAAGWTAMTNVRNEVMIRFLTRQKTHVLDGNHMVFVRRWR